MHVIAFLRYEGGTADRNREVQSAGASHQQIRQALAVCAAFDTTGPLADAFGFEVLSPDGFEAGVRYLPNGSVGNRCSDRRGP